MSNDGSPRSVSDEPQKRQVEAQSAFASTLLNDVEKTQPSQVAGSGKRHGNLYGSQIDTNGVYNGIDEVHAAKAQLLNEALLDIGMGRYQWLLLLTTSMGWFLDYFWLVSFVIIAPSAANEAQFFYSDDGNKLDYLYISQFVGLTAGAIAWPAMSDSLGRRWIFTSTLVLMGMGGLVGAGMSAYTGLCVVGFVVGLAVAGNQSVDAMIIVESLPASHQYLVALQGVSWGLGQVVAYAVGWAFIEQFTCGTDTDTSTTTTVSAHLKRASSSSSSCHYVSNKGWRYVWWTFGCITLFLYLCRIGLRLYETPKYFLARRRDAEAIQIVNNIATYNKRSTWLTEPSFARIDSSMDATVSKKRSAPMSLLRSTGVVGLSTLALLWIITGITFPLYQNYLSDYLVTKGVTAVTADSVTTDYLYSRYLYVAICAIPGPLVAALLIEAKLLGRKRSGAVVAILTGLVMLLSTLSRSRGAALACECIISFLQFTNLAIITVYTVEVFPAPIRGAGLAVMMGCAWRLFGLIATIIVTFDASAVAGGAAVWFCGAVWILAAGLWVVLPIETMAKSAA